MNIVCQKNGRNNSISYFQKLDLREIIPFPAQINPFPIYKINVMFLNKFFVPRSGNG